MSLSQIPVEKKEIDQESDILPVSENRILSIVPPKELHCPMRHMDVLE